MEANQYDVYAEFLLACKDAMGSVDFERFDHDSEYRSQICNRIIANASDELYDIAEMINREIENEETTHQLLSELFLNITDCDF